MTMQTESGWVCPACRTQNTATIWQTVNATLNPELAAKIADGSLFTVTCRQCHYSGRFNYSTQFHDMTRHLYCMYHAEQEPLPRETQEFMESAARQFRAPYQFRIVYDLDAFIEWGSIWRDGLDDATMLCMRLMLYVQIEREKGAYPVMLRYLRRILEPGEEPEDEVFEYAVVLSESSSPITMQVAAYMYANLLPKVQAIKTKFFPMGKWIDWTDQTALQMMKHLR